MMRLEHEIALITGASRGIGLAIAQRLGDMGATVVGTATTGAGAERISALLQEKKLTGKGIVMDVTREEKAFIEAFAPRILGDSVEIRVVRLGGKAALGSSYVDAADLVERGYERVYVIVDADTDVDDEVRDVMFRQQNLPETLQKQGGFIPGIRPGPRTGPTGRRCRGSGPRERRGSSRRAG